MSGKKCHCEEGLAEWIMSYADMITILMAFFVVMYSMAGRDNEKEQAVLKALRDQFGPMMPGWGVLLPGMLKHDRSSMIELPHKGGMKGKNTNRGGADQQRLPEGEHARMHAPWSGEQLRVGGAVYFPDSGSHLNQTQKHSLELIVNEIGGKPQRIEIRGHTARRQGTRSADSQDPWDQAYGRCRSTMEYLLSLGIDPNRIRMSVAGDNEPLPNRGTLTPYDQNSRVEVFMLNEVVDTNSRKPWLKNPAPDENKPSSIPDGKETNPEGDRKSTTNSTEEDRPSTKTNHS